MAIKMIKIEVKEGRIPWLIGSGTIFAGLIIGFLSVFYAKDSFSFEASNVVVVLFIILAGAVMCICAKNRRLIVQDESLCYVNCFGRKKTFMLSEVGYCRVALESGGSRDYLILYDISGAKLCKLEFNMKNTGTFLQYLMDNEIKIECSKNSDLHLKWIVNARAITLKESASVAKEAYEKAENLIEEWTKRNKSFGAEWKFGLAFYIEEEFAQEKQLWEQEGAPAGLVDDLWEAMTAGLSGGSEEDEEVMLPEGLFIVIEGYLQKEGKFVIDKKNQAVSIVVKFMQVSESFKAGEALKIHFFEGALEYLSEQLLYYEQILPKRRYHTEDLELRHELKKYLPPYLEK